VCTAAYLLGEFGRLITNEVSPTEQFKLLHSLFPPATQPTKGLLMTAYIKIYLLDPQVCEGGYHSKLICAQRRQRNAAVKPAKLALEASHLADGQLPS
jgi:hypothetical protein